MSPHIQDSVHSTNTLSYAAPFLTIPPKPRGPAPYDAKDPRTWDTDRTREWLQREFGKHVKKRMVAEKKVKAKHARLAGKAADTREVQVDDLGLDLEKVCPDGYTAKNLGALYTTQFVERCIAARTSGKLEHVKQMSVEVIGQLFYLVMTAKTRSRNAVMKSRKPLAVETYGAYIPTFQFLLCLVVNRRRPECSPCRRRPRPEHGQSRGLGTFHEYVG